MNKLSPKMSPAPPGGDSSEFAADRSPWSLRPRLQMGLILFIGLSLYLHTFNVPFIFDDFVCIKDNPAVANFSYFTDYSLVRALSIDNDIKNSFALRPVVYLTFALNNKMNSFDVVGFHIVNTLIHLGNALLVYLLVQTMLRRREEDPVNVVASGLTPYLPLLVALLFVVHPLQTQAVTYIVQRFTSLATFFYLLALLLYIRARTTSRSWQQGLYYGSALVVAVVAMKSKEIAFTLPLILALYDLFFLSGPLKRRLLGLVPFFLTLAIIPLTIFWLSSLQEADSLRALSQSMDLVNFAKVSRWDYLITQFGVLAVYLRMLFLPFGQNLDHDYRLAQSFWEARVIGPFLLHLSLAAAAVASYLRSRRISSPRARELRLVAFGILWFFITLSVESSIIPIDDLLVEHRCYLPSLGFFLAILAAASAAAGSVIRRQRLLLAIILFAILALSIATLNRNELYRDATVLYQDVVKKSPQKPRAHISLGLAHLDKGEYDAAIREFTSVLAIKPDQVEVLIQLGYCLAAKGQGDQAMEKFQAALRLSPDNPYAHTNLGRVYQCLGRRAEAEEEFQAALHSVTNFEPARSALARLYEEEGRRQEAIEVYRLLLKDYPNDPMSAKRLEELMKR